MQTYIDFAFAYSFVRVSNLQYMYATPITGSEIEKQEIREAFVRSCGNIKFVIESVPFLTAGDKPRVLQIIDKLIEKGEMSSREALKRQKDLQSKLKPKIEKEVKPSKPVTKPNQNLTLRQEALKNKKID